MPAREFETERLKLVLWRPEFEAEILAMNADHDVMQYIGKGKALPIDSDRGQTTMEGQRGLMQRGDELGIWSILSKEADTFLGWTGLFELNMTGPQIELGYRLNRTSWGHGYASEASARLIPHAFETVGLDEICAVTYPENTASRRVLEKLGFIYLGMTKYGDIDTTDYRLSRADWMATR